MPREAKPKGPKIITHRKPDGKRERCYVCKKMMDYVGAGHLKEHGITIARYERMYGARRPPLRSEAGLWGSSDQKNDSIVNTVGERLSESKVWIACLADEVSERMLNGPLRHRIVAQLVTMLAARSKVHGEAITILNGALGELREEWRLTQGGENGGPTDTDTILRIVDRAAKLVADAEDAVQRTMKLALEEQKAAHQYADALGPTLYAGTGEKLDMPVGLPASDRETMRNLLALIGKAANERGTIDAEGTPLPPSPRGALLVDASTSAIPSSRPENGHNDASSSENGLVDASSRLVQGIDDASTSHPPGAPPPHPHQGPAPSRGALTDPNAARTSSGASTERGSTPEGRPRVDEEGPVNDPGAGARTAGGPAQGRKSLGHSPGDGEGVIVSGGGDATQPDDGSTPAPAPKPVKGPRQRGGGGIGDGGRAKRAKHAAAWAAHKKAEGIAKVGKGKKGKRGPNKGNDRGGSGGGRKGKRASQ